MSDIHLEQPFPKLSVLCISYNHEPYLRQALDSILMQKLTFPIEVLVGEDCSPDHSREILREYEERYPGFFQMLYREENMGGTRNGYDLCMRARGQYVVTLETDDYWTDPCKLQKQVAFLDAHPEYIGCAHDCSIIDEHGHTTCSSMNQNIPDPGKIVTLQDFLLQGTLFQTTSFMYRNPFRDGGDYSILYKAHPLIGDVTLISILLLRGNVWLMSERMSAYRQVIKKGGTSFLSQVANDPALVLENQMLYLISMEEYFHGKIYYSYHRFQYTSQYLFCWLKRRAGFTSAGMRYMWDHAGPTVQKKLVRWVLGYPVREVKRYWNRIWKRKETDEQ